MTNSDFNWQGLSSDFQRAYNAVMYSSRLSSNDYVQKNAIAFGQQVKQTSPNDYLNTSVPDEHGYYNQLNYSRFRVEPSENLPSSTSKSSDGAEVSGATGNFFTSPPKIQTSPIIQADNLANEFARRCLTRNKAMTRRQHIHKGEKPYKCKDCNKDFVQKSALTEHQRIHSGEKPYKCKECEKYFAQRSSLSVHLRTHSGEKPFECAQCNRRFTQSSHLKTHQRTHAAEKSNVCKQCGMCFVKKHALKTHQRIHTGEKFYKCSQCDKIFARKGYLKAHMQIHTDVKPYECRQCDKRFARRYYLKSHEKRVHAKAVKSDVRSCSDSNFVISSSGV